MYAKARPNLSWTCRPGTRTACGMVSTRYILYMTSQLVGQSQDLNLRQTEVPRLFRYTWIGVPEFVLSRLSCRILAVSNCCSCRGMRSNFGLLTSACILAPEATGPPAYPSASLWSILQRVRALSSLLRPLQYWKASHLVHHGCAKQTQPGGP